MCVKWLIAFLYFMMDWFIPGVGLPEKLYVLKAFVLPIFLILVIVLFGRVLIKDFRKLNWKETLAVVVVAMLLIIITNQLFDTAANARFTISYTYLLSAVSYAPFFEEIIFRYCILPISGSSITKGITLIISAAFFSMVHGFTLGYFVCGIIFGSVYLVKKNIWYSIIVHYSNNLIAVGIILFHMT